VDLGGGSNPNGLFCDGSGGNSTGVWGCVSLGLLGNQLDESNGANALPRSKRSALKKSGSGS
jgi:hypothetical protein